MPVNLLDDEVMNEAAADAAEYHWTLNFGPQHPATHTTLRLVLELDGERIVKATPHIGYLHSGFEKLGEHLTFNQYVTIVDRKNYISPPMNEVAWHNAVEKLLGHRADAPLQVHPGDHRRAGADQRPPALHRRRGARPRGLHGVPLRLQPPRADLRRLRADVGLPLPPRLHPGRRRALRLRRQGPPADRAGRCSRLPKVFKDMEKLLFRNRIFLERMRGVGVLTRDQAIDLSCTGPIARASGVTYDLRKDQPYLAYPDLEFSVPYATEGDCYARFLVRMEEMGQSGRDPRAVHRRACRRARSTCRSPRSSRCPTRRRPTTAWRA